MSACSFVQILSELTTDPNITAVEFRLYTILMDLGLKGRGFSQAGHSYLAHLCNCHPKTIAKSLKRLREQGYISIERVGLNRNDKIRCLKTVKRRKDNKVPIKKDTPKVVPSIIDKRTNTDIEHRSAEPDSIEEQKRPYNELDTEDIQIDQEATNACHKSLQDALSPKTYTTWFNGVEVIETSDNHLEMKLNTGILGYDFIQEHYLQDIETILGRQVSLTI